MPTEALLEVMGPQQLKGTHIMKRPVSLTVAVVLQWIAAIFLLITGIPILIAGFFRNNTELRNQLDQAIADSGQEVDFPVDYIFYGMIVAGVVLIVAAVVRIVLAVFLAKGHNWARIVITVFIAFGIISAVTGLFSGQFLPALVSLVVEIAILWLMWNRDSSAYIEAAGNERAAAKQGSANA